MQSDFRKTEHPLYNVWRQMRQRCSNKNNVCYQRYGGRGIKVCERWDKSFLNFIADVGERPEGTELDRKDNDKGYYLDNCHWVTHKVNSDNRSNNQKVTFNGSTKTITEWSKITGVPRDTIRHRLRAQKRNMRVRRSIEDILTTPVGNLVLSGGIMAKVKKQKELPSRAELEALAEQMNEVMGLDPKIKFNRKTTDEQLIDMIKENATEDDVPQIYHSDFEEDADDPDKDVFSDDAKETLEALEIEIGDEPEGDDFDEMDMDALKEYIEEEGLDIKVKKSMDEDAVRDLIREAKSGAEEVEEEPEEKPAPKKGGKKQKEEEPEEEPEEEEKPKKGSKKKEEEKPAKKGSKKKEEVEEEPEEEEEKPAKKGAKKDEKPAKKEDKKPAKKEKKSKKYGRIDSIVEAIQKVKKSKKGITFDALNDASCDLFDEHNDTTTPRPYSNTWLQASLTIQVALEAATLKDGKYTFN